MLAWLLIFLNSSLINQT